MSCFRQLVIHIFAIVATVIVGAQPAPPITLLAVASVNSGKGGFEVIQPNQFATINGHAGTSFQIKTKELGYGNNPIAKLQNFTLTQTSIKTITDSGKVIGFEREWSYAGAYLNGGQFTYQNTSTNSPGDTKYTSLNLLPYYDPPAFSSENPKFFSSDYDPATTSGKGGGTSNPLTWQFIASNPDGSPVTYTVEKLNGFPVSANIVISQTGLFYWDKKESSTFTRSTSCPYPYFAQVNIVAHNSHGVSTKWMVTLQVLVGPPPPCQAPPGGIE